MRWSISSDGDLPVSDSGVLLGKCFLAVEGALDAGMKFSFLMRQLLG